MNAIDVLAKSLKCGWCASPEEGRAQNEALARLSVLVEMVGATHVADWDDKCPVCIAYAAVVGGQR